LGLILDTNAVSAMLSGDEGIGQILPRAHGHHLPLFVVGEYQFGLLRMALPSRNRLQALFRRLEAGCAILYPSRQTADLYAIIRFELRKLGRPIPESDLWIAALAKQHRLEILSRDAHFDLIDGIQRVDW
jgi:tRNA(fMet)-specific endonuclease VapC